MKIRSQIFKKSIINWYNNDPFSQSAAIAYYTIFSFPALVFIYLALASLFNDKEHIQQEVVSYIGSIVGKEGAGNIQSIIESTAPSYTSFWALAFGAIILIFAGLKLFLQLQKTLNMIWRVEVDKHVNILSLVKQRVIALSVMMGIGFVLIASLFITSLLAALGDYISSHISEEFMLLIKLANIAISVCTITLLFTILLKMLPDVEILWKYAFAGGLVSAILFIIGEYLLGLYFELAKPASAYGVTASVILLMLWVSYTTVILLFGAEFSKAALEYNKEKSFKISKIAKEAEHVKK